MKASKYNFIYKYNEDNYIFYNSFSNALALVESENYEKYKKFVDDGERIDDHELLSGLEGANFIIDKDFDEKKSLKLTLLNDRFNKSHLSLVIAPTTNCNFDCTYCYEKNSNKESRMTPLIQEKIIDYCEQSIKAGVKSINILWYGGEPLIATDIVREMSDRIIGICDENDVQYSAGMISNGYNLNEEVCAQLEKCRIGNIQITLDGPKGIHDNRRYLLNGGPTFDRILQNVKIACEKFHITIRVNVDAENSEGLEELLTVLEDDKLRGKIGVYVAMVEDNNDCYSKGSCMTKKGFSQSEVEFLTKMYEKGITKNNPWLSKYPMSITVQCIADSINGLVISPNGTLYKCCNDIGIEGEEIGNILNVEAIKHSKILFDYLLYDPTEDEHCRDCKILPICMGGCFKSRGGEKGQRCSSLKYNLKEYLIENARILDERQSS